MERGDRIVQDLAARYHVVVARATDGGWSPEELHTLEGAVADLAAAMGGVERFTRALGGVAAGRADARYRGMASKDGVRFTTSAVSFDRWTVIHELAHTWDARLGWRLSKALETRTGGFTCWPAMLLRRWLGRCDEARRWPGCNRFGYFYGGRPPAGSDRNFNRREDLAESVAAYVYPVEAQSRVERFKDDARYREFLYYPDYTQTERWAVVDALFGEELALLDQQTRLAR